MTSLTASMVRDAVEELEKRRQRVPMSLLVSHFQRFYPVDRNVDILKRQLSEQADKAVKLGWLRRYSDNTYCIADFRWQAMVQEYETE